VLKRVHFQVQKRNQKMKKIIDELQQALAKAVIGRTQQELFVELKKHNCSRVGMMIIDSAIKRMPLEHLDNTLLLTKEQFQLQLQYATLSLENIINSSKNQEK
jgi:hypothetical protein